MFNYNKHLIFLTLSGSRAYGTNTAESDYDYRGIIIPPSSCNDGFLGKFEQKESLDGYGKDSTAYSIQKFFQLASQCNPNIVELLFIPDDLAVVRTKYSDAIRAEKQLFLSKKARASFEGYAYQQLHRLKNHKAWWDQEKLGQTPPKPDREALGLPAVPQYSKEKLNNILSLPAELVVSEIRDYVEKERIFYSQKAAYDKWIHWKTTRNPARYELEKKYGADFKHGAHLVRLTLMCEELLRDGKFFVRRPDAEMLMDIRNGKWSYEQLMDFVKEKKFVVEELYKKSTLPDEPDVEKLNELCIELVEMARKDNFGK